MNGIDAMSDIAKNMNYLTPSRYISGRIIEYDLKAANISILRDKQIITQDRYEYLLNLPKINREIEIGLMEKDNYSIYEQLQNGIIEAKDNLIKFNKIDDDQIVRIANDAVYINSELNLKYTKFGDFTEFRIKSINNIFCKLNNLIIFCNFLDSGNINIDIKGLDKDNKVLELHKDYMISVIISTIALLERSGIQDAISYLSEICEKYIKRELPVEFYRELNKESSYRLIQMNSFAIFNIDMVSQADINYIDISYNYNILRELWSILFEIYTIRRR